MRAPAIMALAALAFSFPLPLFAAEDTTAVALVRKGAELFKRQDYGGARAAFARAYELDPKASTLFNLALSELNSEDPVDAVSHLREYLTHSEEPPAKLESVRTKWLPRAESRTARLEVYAPAGAQLLVDGVAQQRPLSGGAAEGQPPSESTAIAVAAGEHDVISRQGSIEESQHVVARGGEALEVHFQRVPNAAPSQTSVGWLGAQSGQETREGAAATPRAKWMTVIALGSGAVALAAVGLGFGLAAQSSANDAAALHAEGGWSNSTCSGPIAASALCARLKNDVDENREYWALSTASYIGAGVLAAASAATWGLWKPKSAPVAARPALGPRGAGLELVGRW